MDTNTLIALKGSIAKWEKIVAGTGSNFGSSNCPLCQMFNTMNQGTGGYCDGCPVKATTGLSGCSGTPYDDYENLQDAISWYNEYRTNDGDPIPEKAAELHAIAVRELDFLKSLLPLEEIANVPSQVA